MIEGILLALELMKPTPQAPPPWFNVQPAYNVSAEHATVRIEGGAEHGKWKLYAFSDIDATPAQPTDLENVYIEARAARTIASGRHGTLRGMVELDAGTGFEDFVRVGASWDHPSGNLNVRALPFDTGSKGPQLGVYALQKLTDRASVSGLVEYNFEPGTAYSEVEFALRVRDSLDAFVQARSSGPLDDLSAAPVIGLKYSR